MFKGFFPLKELESLLVLVAFNNHSFLRLQKLNYGPKKSAFAAVAGEEWRQSQAKTGGSPGGERHVSFFKDKGGFVIMSMNCTTFF